ncbi:MAG: type II toxin-antitoxin system VapB family antitoxin [Ornithinibacter sp.]
MAMNIKKECVHQLARAAAGRTGLSQTSVIEKSVRMNLAPLISRLRGAIGALV